MRTVVNAPMIDVPVGVSSERWVTAAPQRTVLVVGHNEYWLMTMSPVTDPACTAEPVTPESAFWTSSASLDRRDSFCPIRPHPRRP